MEALGGDRAGHDPAEQAVVVHRCLRGSPAHQSTGLELIRNPIVPTSPAIRYET